MVPLLVTLPPFYAVELGLPLATVGLIFLVGRLIDAFWDPVVGALSDRYAPFGSHRKSFMVAGAPIALYGCWALLNPEPDTTGLELLGLIVLFYVGWSTVFIPYQGWGAELSTDYAERTRVAGYREALTFAGYLAATLVPIVVLQWLGDLETPGWGDITRVVGTMFLIGLPLTLLVCLPLVPEVTRHAAATNAPPASALAIVRRNRPFRSLLGFYALDRLSLGLTLTMQPLLLQYVLGLQGEFLALSLVTTVVAASSAPLWPWVTRRLGKPRAYVAANALAVVAGLYVLVVPPSSTLMAVPFFLLLGLSQPGTLILPASMTADAVDYYELRSGRAQAGLHVALLNFVFKVGLAAGIGVGYLWLAAAGFDPQAAQPGDPDANAAIRGALAVLSPVLLLASIWMALRYAIDERRHGVIRRALDRRARVSGRVAQTASSSSTNR